MPAPRSVAAAFPLLAVVVVLANIIAFAGDNAFDNTWVMFPLPSDATLTITSGNALVLLGLLLLYGEIFKATRTGTASIIDHVLSLAVFVVALVEFLVVPRLGHAVFLSILLMCFIDVIAGFTVTIAGARRDFGPGT